MKTKKESPEKKAAEESKPVAELQKTDQPTSKTTKVAIGAGIAVAILQPELVLPGLAIGAGIALSPKLLPAAGRTFRSAAKAVIRAGFQVAHATKDIVAEAGEEVRDLVAEARPETDTARAKNNAV